MEEGEEVGKEGGRRKRRRKKIQDPWHVAIIYNLKKKNHQKQRRKIWEINDIQKGNI